MQHFFEILDQNNKLNYKELVEHASEKTLSEFVEWMRWPVLIGKELFDGDLHEKTIQTYNSTFRFDPNATPADIKSRPKSNAAITRAIYVICKTTEEEETKSNLISIGRSSQNDVTIVDYAISKRHAEVLRKNGKYHIADCKSTNNTQVNGKVLEARTVVTLNGGDQVSFGRFNFVFARSIDLYLLLCEKLNIPGSIRGELWQIVSKKNLQTLQKIAGELELEYEDMNRDELLSMMKVQLSESDMIKTLF